MNSELNSDHQTFESIKRINDHGEECWSARELGRVLGYSVFRNFQPVIQKAMEACTNSNQPKEHNKQLVDAAADAGVTTNMDFAIFQNHGYRGLYGGLDAKDIHQRKGLKKSHKILDYMGSTELAANLFRATQTEEKLRRDEVQGKSQANQTHHQVGAKVRQTISELGGTMPEDLPTPESGIKQLERQQKKISQTDTASEDHQE